MDKKITSIVAYLTWVGLIIAFVIGDRKAARFHLNQSLVIWLAGTLFGIIGSAFAWLPLLGDVIGFVCGLGGLFCFICWFIGLIGAIQGTEKPVPFLGQFRLIK